MKKWASFFLLAILFSGCGNQKNQIQFKNMDSDRDYKNIRTAAVADQFYSGDHFVLRVDMEKYFRSVLVEENDKKPKAIMVPHAGYIFSGPVAAYSYKLLEGKKYDRIILIGNSHTSRFAGIAIDENDAWETPLGLVEVDQVFAHKLTKVNEKIFFNSEVHVSDHVLEVQLPFLQSVLKDDFKIVPILFGNADDEDYKILAQVLSENLGENDLVVASTDMSHYPSYDNANKIDPGTLEKIINGDIIELEKYIDNIENQQVENEQTLLCGIDGVKTVMQLSRILNWSDAKILKYANSGDSEYGDKERVVGYGAVVFGDLETEKNSSNLSQAQKEVLLKLAQDTVETYVRNGKIPEVEIRDEKLVEKQGAFVTLHLNGRLRGCIGQIEPSNEPLWQVVQTMAIEAATGDPRFSPVSANELDKIEYEVSVLSKPKKIEDWQKIELGKHGVIVRKGFRSGVFLPQVATETGWGKEELLAHLCADKAGLAADAYKNDLDVELFVFEAEVF